MDSDSSKNTLVVYGIRQKILGKLDIEIRIDGKKVGVVSRNSVVSIPIEENTMVEFRGRFGLRASAFVKKDDPGAILLSWYRAGNSLEAKQVPADQVEKGMSDIKKSDKFHGVLIAIMIFLCILLAIYGLSISVSV